jgi:hypothetical protein
MNQPVICGVRRFAYDVVALTRLSSYSLLFFSRSFSCLASAAYNARPEW